jgi:cell fate regulator YaaT (PSP1 superfamily)
MYSYFVRLGSLAEVHPARFPLSLPRSRRVIVRTHRGVELGEVVRPYHQESTATESTLRILRPTSDEDELLIRRLERHKRTAVEACRSALTEVGSSAMLLDVDQLLDGGTLIMHFLGPVDEIAESVTKEIAERYESVVRTRHFAKLLRDGCGPGCGTESGRGCGESCSGCSAAAACPTNSINTDVVG